MAFPQEAGSTLGNMDASKKRLVWGPLVFTTEHNSFCDTPGLALAPSAREDRIPPRKPFNQSQFVVSSLSLSQPVRLFVTPWTVFTRFLCPWDFLGKNTGEGCHFLFQWIFPAQELKLCLLHWQVDSFPLSHQESPCQSQEQTPNCAA